MKSTEGIIADAVQTLDTARLGLSDIVNGGPEKRDAGLRNVVVFGRAVTNVLQNLRSTESRFEDWYAPLQKEMESDSLLRFFYNLRSEILKEGTIPTSTSAYIKGFNFPQDMFRFGPPPPNAVRFFIGDRLGGTGWEVRVSGDSIEKYYVQLPPEIGVVTRQFREPPKEHLGAALRDVSIESLCQLYLDYLATVVESAKATFMKQE